VSWWKQDKKTLSWALYDWANSSFSTTIMAVFFPVFFQKYWGQGSDSTLTTARLGTTITIASLIIAFLSPTLGALADQRGSKKLFTFLFMILGVFGCGLMAFIGVGDWLTAAVAYAIAQIGFNASCVFYDAFLPSIAPGKKANQASSLGFGMGYLGGGILLLLNVLMTQFPEKFGLADSTEAVKFSFLSVALWWSVFSIPLFLNVPEPQTMKTGLSLLKATHHSVMGLWATLKGLLHEKNILLFLVAFWLYIDGVYTVMTMAVDFGISIGLSDQDLIPALLIVQFVGFPTAILYGQLAKKWKCRTLILSCIFVYAITVVGAAQMSTAWHFYFLACIIGVVQGGVQALSRSLYSRMIPPAASGEYFGLFNLVGKFASIFGPLLVGWGAYLTGDPRKGMMGLLILFILGGALLYRVKEPQLD